MQPIYVGEGTNYGIRALTISFDAKYILVIGYGYGNNIILRNNQKGKWIILENYFDKIHEYEVVTIRFFNSQNHCVSSDQTKFVIWSIQEQTEKAQILQIIETQAFIISIDLSKNDKMLAIGYLNSDIRIFVKQNGIFTLKQILSQQEQMVSVVKFNLEGTLLASASSDSRVLIWKCKNEKWKKHQELITSTFGIFALNWFPEGNQLIYSSRDCQLSLISANEQNIYRQIDSYKVDQGVIVCGDLTQDGKIYLCGRRSGRLEIFNFNEKYQLQLNNILQYEGSITDIKISPNQQYFVVSLSSHKNNLLVYQM